MLVALMTRSKVRSRSRVWAALALSARVRLVDAEAEQHLGQQVQRRDAVVDEQHARPFRD
jgi:hypothetical protein